VVPVGARAADDGAEDRGSDASATSFEAAHALPRALQIAGAIVAPTTFLTALFAYFGFMYVVAYYRYFGVNHTALVIPLQGYLFMSVSTAVLPLAVLAGAVLLALRLYLVPLDALSDRARHVLHRGVYPAVAVSGVVLIGLVGADALLAVHPFPAAVPEARGLSLSLGVLLIGAAGRLRRELAPQRGERPEHEVPAILTVVKWGSFSLLLGIGLFWAVGSYALRMGGQDADALAANLACAPDVIVYSEKALNLASAGLQEEGPPDTEEPRPEGAYDFRYPGLKLVPQAGDGYLLLPADWSPSVRPAILLPRSDTMRLEFSRSTSC
jgi:hypothetical protein